MGKAAVANAKLAYQSFKRILGRDRWHALERHGAKPQRMLWASTSTKNPKYNDVMYVEPLIGPHTINTMPDETIAAFADHGRAAATVEAGVQEARQIMKEIEAAGVDFRLVTEQLENEGIQKFIEPYDSLLQTIAAKREKYLNARDAKPLEDMARKLRRETIRMTTEAGSGHPTSCMSCADIVSALFFREMRWDPHDPKARNVDTFILSKGHAAPVLWAALSEAGAIDEDLLSLRRIDSTLEGHPTPNNPWVKVATGSLGQGLSAANGMALANRLDGIDARVFCLLGDGECSEGSVWEAAQFASLNKLSNIVAIVDVNGIAQSGPAPYRHDTSVFVRRFQSFGWNTVEIDGHDMADVLDALRQARQAGPCAIIAKTEKGKGVSFLQGAAGWHGKALDRSQMEQALAELGGADIRLKVEPRRIGQFERKTRTAQLPRAGLSYRIGDSVATRDGYGSALKKLGAQIPELVVLDGDVEESTRTKEFADAYPERFFECHIAEQNMAGTALGLAVSDKLPFVATFACFLTRAFDFIRMAGHSRPPQLVFCGSHAGVSIGQDGPSQMGLEDVAMFRAVNGSTVLCPCDAVSAERLTEAASTASGIVYIRTMRSKTPVIYDNEEIFPIGGSKTLRSSENDAYTLVAAGITVREALAAHDSLKAKGIAVRVIDAYSVKPLDVETLARAARETGGLVVVEDHWIDGGLGDAVAAEVSGMAPIHRLGIASEPRSGSEAELLEHYGISSQAIERKIEQLAGG
ncbi:MAG: transketolase, partial [Sulfuricella sp.]|nr:transketolase [Sulfuricella sp.]